MAMDFDTQARQVPVINLSALIDIAFILVIFIVLAANFNRIEELEVALPEASATATADPTSLTITVPPAGPVTVDGQTVPIGDAGAALAPLVGRYESVLLMLDRTTAVERAVTLLDAARGAGFTAVGIATEQPGEGGR